jgi:hypothetical protein
LALGLCVVSLTIGSSLSSAQNTFPAKGSVGVGTTAPSEALDVFGTIGAAPTSDVTGASGWFLIGRTTNDSAVGDANGVGLGISVENGAANAYALTFGVNPTYPAEKIAERMRITSGGAVGIGTSTPAPGYLLDVAGSIHSSGQIYSAGPITASGGIVFPDGSTQASALNSGGQTLTTANSAYGSINITLNATSVPVINFTRWTGNGATQDNAYAGLFYNPADLNFDFGIGTGISTTGSQTATATVLTVNQSGNVGIGTTTPTAKLEVDGNLKLTAKSGASLIFPDGTTQSTAWNGVLCGGDYAESVAASGDRKSYEPGDVLVIAAASDSGDVEKSAEPYSTLVAGIYSTKPGLLGRRQPGDKTAAELPMAMVGIVPAKASAENGPIRRGDLLVTAATPGRVMRATDRERMVGAIVGKALAPLDSGTGLIEVLVSLQ